MWSTFSSIGAMHRRNLWLALSFMKPNLWSPEFSAIIVRGIVLQIYFRIICKTLLLAFFQTHFISSSWDHQLQKHIQNSSQNFPFQLLYSINVFEKISLLCTKGLHLKKSYTRLHLAIDKTESLMLVLLLTHF